MRGSESMKPGIGSVAYPDHLLMNVEDARKHYDLKTRDVLFPPLLHTELVEAGVAERPLDVAQSEFTEIIESFETCLQDEAIAAGLLPSTYHPVDNRSPADAGFVRKEPKIENGQQTQDGKSLFHFNEAAQRRWQRDFIHAPIELKDFLERGYELHAALINFARQCIDELEETHPNISSAFFPKGIPSYSFMRILSYDIPTADSPSLEVAKPHFDVGGLTVQAFADADGFWGRNPSTKEHIDYPSTVGNAHVFTGIGYRKLYDTAGQRAPIRPFYHGVRSPERLPTIKRHAIILFLDAPYVDFGVTAQDTLPQLYQ